MISRTSSIPTKVNATPDPWGDPKAAAKENVKLIPGAAPALGALARFGGPYALPVGELAVGAWFAVTQAHHVVDLVAPGPAQLWRAGGHGGAVWHVLAAIAGAAAAVHGIASLFKLMHKK
jgi:hypothetical protein